MVSTSYPNPATVNMPCALELKNRHVPFNQYFCNVAHTTLHHHDHDDESIKVKTSNRMHQQEPKHILICPCVCKDQSSVWDSTSSNGRPSEVSLSEEQCCREQHPPPDLSLNEFRVTGAHDLETSVPDPWAACCISTTKEGYLEDTSIASGVKNLSDRYVISSSHHSSSLDRLDDEEKIALKDIFCDDPTKNDTIIPAPDASSCFYKWCSSKNMWTPFSASRLFGDSHEEQGVIPKSAAASFAFLTDTSYWNEERFLKGQDMCSSWTSATLSMQGLRVAMRKSKETQDSIQSWEQEQGLPRSHCVTMMHSNRSRRQLLEGKILSKWNGRPLIGEGSTKNKNCATHKLGTLASDEKASMPKKHRK